jgi:uroporphyrinogen-III synthase
VLRAPTLRILPLEEDVELEASTERIITEPPDDVVVTTAIGFRGWIEAADAAGQAMELIEVLDSARILARGPKARGAIRAAGLTEAWAATSETTVEVVERLLEEGVQGRRIAVQLHGLSDPELLARLSDAGAVLEPVQVYRWGPSPDPVAVQRLIEAVCQRSLDVVTFTSAPGSQAFLDAARDAGRYDAVLAALSGDVLAAAVGPVTAGPLVDVGVTPLVPDRYRLGALVRAVADHLVEHRVRQFATVAGVLEVRGQAATLDGQPLTLSPAPMAMLRALARRPGNVLDRTALLAALPSGGDVHAVEVAVGRLRAGLGCSGVVETVVKRGYRLAVQGEA